MIFDSKTQTVIQNQHELVNAKDVEFEIKRVMSSAFYYLKELFSPLDKNRSVLIHIEKDHANIGNQIMHILNCLGMAHFFEIEYRNDLTVVRREVLGKKS